MSNLHIITVATHAQYYFPYLVESIKNYGNNLTVLGFNEKWRGFNDTIAALQDYEVWVTEYNLFDKTYDLRYTNTWAQVLMLSAMNNEFMNNRLVEMLLLHNVGGIFPNFDALDTEHGFRKRMKTKAGRNVLKQRRSKNRKKLSA